MIVREAESLETYFSVIIAIIEPFEYWMLPDRRSGIEIDTVFSDILDFFLGIPLEVSHFRLRITRAMIRVIEILLPLTPEARLTAVTHLYILNVYV